MLPLKPPQTTQDCIVTLKSCRLFKNNLCKWVKALNISEHKYRILFIPCAHMGLFSLIKLLLKLNILEKNVLIFFSQRAPVEYLRLSRRIKTQAKKIM